MTPRTLVVFLGLILGITLTTPASAGDVSGLADVSDYPKGECKVGVKEYTEWREQFIGFFSRTPKADLSSNTMREGSPQLQVFRKRFNEDPPVSTYEFDLVEVFKTSMKRKFFVVLVNKGCVIGAGEMPPKEIIKYMVDDQQNMRGNKFGHMNPQAIEIKHSEYIDGVGDV